MKALQNLRRKVGAMIGGFEGGLSARRLKTFAASRAHVNTLIQAAGADMTARARYLIRNNGYAANAVESWAGNAVGTGIKPSSGISDAPLKDRVQRLWLRWTDESDAEGLTDFYGQQRRAARELFIAGEVFFRVRPRRPEDGLSVPLQLQMLPAEMLPLNHNQLLENGHRIRQGIEFDRIGRRVAYHFLRRHPGDITDPGLAGETVRVPAESVLHIVDPMDAGQLRGVSRFSPALVKLFLLDQYDDAELDRKKVAAMFVGFVRRPERDFDNGNETDDRGEPLLPLEPGQLQTLDDGEDITFSTPADVGGNYESFQYRTLLQVAAALGLPYANLSADMLKANYSNTRAALLEFRRRIEAFQHSVLVFQLCRAVWARWMGTAVLSGQLDLLDYEQRRADYLDCSWLPPRWDWVDPLKDIRAEINAIEAGLKSRTQAIAERGFDAAMVDAEIAGDHRREDSLGLSFGREPVPPPSSVDTGMTGGLQNLEGIAVLPVLGTLVRRSSYIGTASGLTSYHDIEAMAEQAFADPAVRAVLLEIDSSGGEAGGVFDLAQRLRQLAQTSGKPLWAIADEAALSAAYAIACAADRIWLTRTAEVGSIGVVAVHVDESVADAKAGMTYTFLHAGAHKVDGHPHAPLPAPVAADAPAAACATRLLRCRLLVPLPDPNHPRRRSP